MKGVLGIDPGLGGGLALIDDDGVMIEKMPVVESELDLAEATRWLKAHRERIGLAVLEQVHAFQKASKSSMLKFGRTVGAIEGLLAALEIPMMSVRPHVWCKEMHAGAVAETAKAKSRQVAGRLFPSVPVGKHDGMIDALLIAEYGRRKLRGQA
jgi:hypothetical protein